MSDIEQVAAAEARMNAARNALMSYIEAREPIDRDRHRRLVARVKKAEAEFLQAVSESGK